MNDTSSPRLSSSPSNVVSINEKRAAYVVMTNVEVTRTILGTLGTTAYGVYAFLDTYCNAEKKAWPSEDTIAENVRLSVRQVRRVLHDLADALWIEIAPRYNQFGFVIGNEYTLPHHATPSDKTPDIARTLLGHGDVENVRLGNTKVSPKVNAKKGDSPLYPPRQKRAPDYSASFEDWWALFPRKENKAKAFEAWTRLNPDAALTARIMERTALYAGCQKVADGYIQLPTTFLNGRRWEDEMVPAGQRPALTPPATYRGRDIGLSNDDLLAIARGERP